LITHKDIIELHNLDIAVNPWTVNTREDIIKYTSWGCDALITDVPDFCRQVLKEIE
jgi:glycerophosphoryl diester phosphodiesterase